MALLDCDNGAQPAAWCPTTTDEALPSVLGLLPSGPAWDGAAVANTMMNKFWRAISSVTAYTYSRLCDYLPEFHCNTVNESMDQWLAEYGLPDECDLYGNNLCTKATVLGGQDFATFIAMARDAGWVITCENIPTTNLAGVFQAGCTTLSYCPEPIDNGSTLGYGAGLACTYGAAVEHPEPEYWDADKVRLATCVVPGSNLGLEGGPPDCCFIAGYYEVPEQETAIEQTAGYCLPEEARERIDFDCPVATRPKLIFEPCDATGKYPIAFGNLFAWRVTVDLKASAILQGGAAITVPEAYVSTARAGAFQAGCTELCVDQPPAEFVLCFLETIKPAHTILVTTVQ